LTIINLFIYFGMICVFGCTATQKDRGEYYTE